MTSENSQLLFKDILGASVKDMRNSLGQVLYTLEGQQVSDNADDASNAQYEVVRIQNVINQLYGLYLLDSDALTVQMQETYLYELVEDVLANMGSLIQSKSIDVTIEGDDIYWYIDPYLVSCIIQIALLNAVRYTKDQIHVSFRQQDGGVMVSIIDNGSGYPDSVLEQFAALVNGGCPAHLTSQNTSWLYCERIAALHMNQGRQGKTTLSNDAQTGGGRMDLFLP